MHPLLALSGPDWAGLAVVALFVLILLFHIVRGAKKGVPSADRAYEICWGCGAPVPVARTEDYCQGCGATVPLPNSHYMGPGTEPRAPRCDECHEVLQNGQPHVH
jgi:hypothetical protein